MRPWSRPRPAVPPDLPVDAALVAFLTARLDDEADERPGDVAAKRAIIGDARPWMAWLATPDLPADYLRGMARTHATVLRHLASGYDTHPDYDARWRP